MTWRPKFPREPSSLGGVEYGPLIHFSEILQTHPIYFGTLMQLEKERFFFETTADSDALFTIVVSQKEHIILKTS